MFATVTTASGQAIISSTDGINTVYLGVRLLGELNQTGGPAVNGGAPGATGIAYENATTGGARDATSPGCLCEGWGVSGVTAAAVSHSGFANVSSGTGNLTSDSFVTDDAVVSAIPPHGTFATSNVHVTSLPGLTVSQAYTIDVPGALFKDSVTITNSTGGTLSDVKYVRVMDWDVPFTEFADIVSIVGTATTTDLEFSNDQGFATADPLAANPPAIVGGTTNVDFIDSGPADHGAFFRFNFGSLANGDSITFSIFYGAAPTELGMLAALGLASEPVELYSLGQSSPPSGSPALGTPITYAFAFSGVGGVIVVPPVPEPATIAVWSGMIALGSTLAWRARRQRKNAA
jgi:type IV pilus assembly protein PilY1